MSDTIEGLAYKTRPLYAGKPGSCPLSVTDGARDWIELSRARRSAA